MFFFYQTTPGFDVAGVVVRVGEKVKKFKIGDEVYGSVSRGVHDLKKLGSLSEYTFTEESALALKPSNLSFIEAASIPLAIGTAYGSLESVASSIKNQSVLILGGAGGVGSFAIQV